VTRIVFDSPLIDITDEASGGERSPNESFDKPYKVRGLTPKVTPELNFDFSVPASGQEHSIKENIGAQSRTMSRPNKLPKRLSSKVSNQSKLLEAEVIIPSSILKENERVMNEKPRTFSGAAKKEILSNNLDEIPKWARVFGFPVDKKGVKYEKERARKNAKKAGASKSALDFIMKQIVTVTQQKNILLQKRYSPGEGRQKKSVVASNIGLSHGNTENLNDSLSLL